MNEAVIVSAARTPVGRAAKGAFSTTRPDDLGAIAVRGALARVPALDVADLIPHRYHLEVSSPGVERPLRKERDFVRFTGQKAKLRLHTASHGDKVVTGVLSGADGGKVRVVDGSRNHEISIDQIASARLVFEFGPAPKPGGSKPGKKQKR